MSRTTDFSCIRGIARIDWILKTETPLVIKSGTTSEYRKDKKEIDFNKKSDDDKTDASVSDFYFTVCFDAKSPDKSKAIFRMPSSSIRGSLRNYTIKRLVKKDLWEVTQAPDKRDGIDHKNIVEYENKIKKALNDPGYHLIQNFFGMAMDTKNIELRDEGAAGRLKVICDDHIWPVDDINKKGFPFAVASRSPLDRNTRGTKTGTGGLHNFMELKPGFEFSVVLRIVNPVPEDLGFIGFWERSINQGLIRLGGLRTVGKGRITVENKGVTLFSRHTEGFFLMGESCPIETEVAPKRDILDEIFPCHKLNWEKEQKKDYLKRLNDKFTNYTGR